MEETYFWTSRDFLEKILQESKNNFDLSVSKSTVQKANAKGDNYISKLFRVTVDSENPVEKKTFFVKVLPDDDMVREHVEQSSTFPIEMKMYKETLPYLNKVLYCADPLNARNFGPECYYLSSAEEPLVLIMEDMKEKGYLMANRRKGLDLSHCLLVMKTIAKFHACSLTVHFENPSSIEKYSTNLFFEDACDPFWNNCLRYTLTALAEVVKKWDNFGDRLAEKLLARVETFRDDMRTLLNVRDDPFKVLNHGDLWVNNILFRYDEERGDPEDAVLIDFQFCLYSSPAIDLQMFMHTSPTDHVRVNHTEDLLQEYHKELCHMLRLLGMDDKIMTFSQLLEEYEKKSLFGAFVAFHCLAVILSDPSDAFDFEGVLRGETDETAFVRRAANEDYAAVIRHLLVVFESKGII